MGVNLNLSSAVYACLHLCICICECVLLCVCMCIYIYICFFMQQQSQKQQQQQQWIPYAARVQRRPFFLPSFRTATAVYDEIDILPFPPPNISARNWDRDCTHHSIDWHRRKGNHQNGELREGKGGGWQLQRWNCS